MNKVILTMKRCLAQRSGAGEQSTRSEYLGYPRGEHGHHDGQNKAKETYSYTRRRERNEDKIVCSPTRSEGRRKRHVDENNKCGVDLQSVDNHVMTP